MNRQIILARRPSGAPGNEDFAFVETPVPAPEDGQLLLRTIYLSLDPYMRGRMSDAPSYAPPVEIGGVMVGATVSEVQESRHPGFRARDIVLCYSGWQDYALSDGEGLRKLTPGSAPISTALGVLGMPGLTAYVGMLDIGQPRPGETVVVSAASGAVGAVAAQLAKIKGARVVGVAGADEKLAYLRDELGIETVVSHRSNTLGEDMAAACPDGVDVYYENVGGAVFEAVWPLMTVGARIPVCGLIAHYNDTALPEGPDHLPRVMRDTLRKRITIRGFIISDHQDREPDFLRKVGTWVASGTLRYREDIVEGLEKAPKAFRGLLEGRNFGKLIVQVANDPCRTPGPSSRTST